MAPSALLGILALDAASSIGASSCTAFSEFRAPVNGPVLRLGAAPLSDAPRVRGRDSIPYSFFDWMPEFLKAPHTEFPAIFQYTGTGDARKSGQDLSAFIESDLHRFGAAVIKGLPVDSAMDFSKFLHGTDANFRDYVGGVTKRHEAAPKVFPASGEDPAICMEPHNDNTYWTNMTLRIVLYSKIPPGSGGQAMLTDGRAVLKQLREEQPELVEELKVRGMRYLHFYPDADTFTGYIINSWQAAYASGCNATAGCDTRAVAEAALEKDGRDYEWTEDGLRQWEIIDAIKVHPVTGEDTWTNQLSAMHCSVFHNHPSFPELHLPAERAAQPCEMHGAMPFHTTWADGTEFAPKVLEVVREAQWRNSVAFDYGAGDIILIDNYPAMHGRFSFGGGREIYISLLDEPTAPGAFA